MFQLRPNKRHGKPTSRAMAFALIALVAGSVPACSERQDPTGTNGGNGGGNVVTIDLMNFSFSDADVTISPGTTVRWTNTTNTFHTVTPDGHSEWDEWQTTTEGETFEVTFDDTGTFPYFCVPHESLGMTGVIEVQ